MSPKEIKKAVGYLKEDTRFKKIIEKSPLPKFTRGRDPFEALAMAITYQQLSGASAGAIWKRFKAVLNGELRPEKVLKLKESKMREAGLSRVKIAYLQDLSKKFLDGTIEPNKFKEMTDEAIRTHLIAVKGVGRWTADMFLMFTLHRPDVLPVGDLGIQKGFQKLFKLMTLPDAKKMEKLALSWRPYRTIACIYLWKLQNGNLGQGDW
jgi:DNA-3-methyladenine glycosylase II